MSAWTPAARAAALSRLAGLAQRGLPWTLGFEVLAEEHGAAALRGARRALAEGASPETVLAAAGLISPDERALLERAGAALPATLGLLAEHARDTGRVRDAVWDALAYPAGRLLALCAAAAVLWSVATSSGTAQAPVPLLALGVVLGATLVWAAPIGAGWLCWRVGLGRGLLERLVRALPGAGRIATLYSAALVWRTLGLGLELGRPLPDALRATRDAFARGSWSWGEVDGLLPAAAEGADLPALLSGLDAEHLREEHLLRVAQERGSLAADVLALAALRREQLLDVARTEGAALLLFADAALMLATAGMLIVLMVGSDGGPFALLRLLQQ